MWEPSKAGFSQDDQTQHLIEAHMMAEANPIPRKFLSQYKITWSGSEMAFMTPLCTNKYDLHQTCHCTWTFKGVVQFQHYEDNMAEK